MAGLQMPEKIPEGLTDNIKGLFASERPAKLPQKIMNFLEVYGCFKLNIAVTGESGAGKSSLINAFLKLRPDDAGAAATGVVETTMQATMYEHANFPHIRFWDLPGMGTPSFTSKSYAKTMNLNLYDMFIVVLSERVRENNMLLIDEIAQQKKPFYFIRTKIDNDIRSQRRKRGFSELAALNKMRDDCENYLKEKNLDNHVFLVSAHDLRNYDMPRLMDTFKNEVYQVRAELFSDLLDKVLNGWWLTAKSATWHAQKTGKIQAEDVTKLYNIYKETGFGDVKLKTILKTLIHFQLDVAVLGETGSGATTLVRALTGLENEGFNGNPVMSFEYPGVRFWDISGIESVMDYSMYEMEQVLLNYDFHIIIVSDWQKARHIKLAEAVSKFKRHFLLVQTKVDCHLQAQRDLCCDDTKTLDRLQAQYTQEIQKANLPEPQIFLINSLDRSELDFAVLESALAIELNTTRSVALAHYMAKILRQR